MLAPMTYRPKCSNTDNKIVYVLNEIIYGSKYKYFRMMTLIQLIRLKVGELYHYT